MPQLKKPITSIDQMTCENCIHYQKLDGYDYCINPNFCINPNSLDWDKANGECCSVGEWLYFGKWFSDETKEQLRVMSYSELYLRFAELNEQSNNL